MNKTLVIGIAIVVIIGAVAGFYLMNMQSGPGAGGGEKTFIVIGYYWGFKIYDSNYNEIDQIVVNKGDKVKIIFLNARSFAEEFYSQLEAESIQNGVGGLSGDDLRSKIEEAVSVGQIDHGLQIVGLGKAIATNYKKFSGTAKSLEEFFQKEPQDAINSHTLTFTADKAGSFDFQCFVVCGYGHSFMILENALVVQG